MIKDYSVDGYADGVHVLVKHDPDQYPEQYGAWWVWIDGNAKSVHHVLMARDGGTIELKLSDNNYITFPHKATDQDRIPKLNGRNIVEERDSLSTIKELVYEVKETEEALEQASQDYASAVNDLHEYLKAL